MQVAHQPARHPLRVSLHNEIHARPPEAMNAPLAISHLVMVCDAQELEASRAQVGSGCCATTICRNQTWPVRTCAWTSARCASARAGDRLRPTGLGGCLARALPVRPAPVGSAGRGRLGRQTWALRCCMRIPWSLPPWRRAWPRCTPTLRFTRTASRACCCWPVA